VSRWNVERLKLENRAPRQGKQPGASTAALRQQKYVELINPPFSKCNDADQFLVVEVAPELAGSEDGVRSTDPLLACEVVAGWVKHGRKTPNGQRQPDPCLPI
jgi:hypothetical protein